MSALRDFATWEPLLRLMRVAHAERLAQPGGYVAGQIGRSGWSVPLGRGRRTRDEFGAVERVQGALVDAGVDDVSFAAEISPGGGAVLHLFGTGPAVEAGIGGPYPGALTLSEGSVPEPWRRLPDSVVGAVPDPVVDLGLLERTLRERIPDAIGATEAEIAAAEARLGVALPEELKVLYRVTRARWEDWGEGYADAERVYEAVGCELFPLDRLYVADVASRPCRWKSAAMAAVVTPADAAVQGLVGSPGWIAFGDNGGGDRMVVDLTPGPRGYVGQIVMLDHEQVIGAGLLADSLTDLVVNRRSEWCSGRLWDRPPVVARVRVGSLLSVRAAADPGLEVLSIGGWEGEPVSLVPLVGLPRLRTLVAYPGTLADPLEIARLRGLEFLELGPEEWRVLLAAGGVPSGLSAAAIAVQVQEDWHPLSVVALANELLGLWGRPPISHTVVEGKLGPVG
ncbi:SMI1/KNR4 family protein [Streptomyces sp. NPDC002054]|uniref:SMI1/KNR4 family protein n=1 Tax=Streptomyces sp. NPDC002054 TaxID=3154663 RepID=UPI00331D8097